MTSVPIPSDGLDEVVSRHEPLLGTTVEVRVIGRADVTDRVIAEITRLQSVFSIHDPASALSRWRCGDIDDLPEELVIVLGLARRWQMVSAGAFNVSSRALTSIWRVAAESGAPPDPGLLDAAAARVAEPPYDIIEGRPVRTGDCSDVDLNALAKGWIVDRAIDRVADDYERIVVNAGGDLAHCGVGIVEVGIEDPHRPYDNVPPLTRVRLSNAAIATSGSARRGVRIAGVRYGHVLDPRTGRPADRTASVSVVAADAATADALATVIGVTAATDLDRALAIADEHGAAALVVLADRHRAANDRWAQITSG